VRPHVRGDNGPQRVAGPQVGGPDRKSGEIVEESGTRNYDPFPVGPMRMLFLGWRADDMKDDDGSNGVLRATGKG